MCILKNSSSQSKTGLYTPRFFSSLKYVSVYWNVHRNVDIPIKHIIEVSSIFTVFFVVFTKEYEDKIIENVSTKDISTDDFINNPDEESGIVRYMEIKIHKNIDKVNVITIEIPVLNLKMIDQKANISKNLEIVYSLNVINAERTNSVSGEITTHLPFVTINDIDNCIKYQTSLNNDKYISVTEDCHQVE